MPGEGRQGGGSHDGGRPSTLPLAGVTVVGLEHAVAAPFATRHLADLGARVIKVERPGRGDFARRYDETVHGLSSYFVWLNRSKESLSLDVKDARGRAILQRLLARADVFVHNLGPGSIERLGFDQDALGTLNPRLISCAINGFGSAGSWSRRKAYDLLIQCQTGLVSITGGPDASARVGISVADIAAGMYAYSGVLTSLYVRATTGAARPVEVSLFDALAEWMSQPAYYTRHAGAQPSRLGTHHATIAPYGAYRASDGREVLFSIQTETEWRVLCQGFLGRPELADDPRFATSPARVTNRAQLDEIIRAHYEMHVSADIMARLDDLGIANSLINDVGDFLRHPVLAERGRWRHVETPDGAFDALLPPAALGGVPPAFGPVPAVGEHTDAILAELGYEASEIAALRADAVV